MAVKTQTHVTASISFIGVSIPAGDRSEQDPSVTETSVSD